MTEQPAPVPTTGAHIADLVIADIRTRKQVGVERYGTPLQAHNGRDALIDAYEEALDLVQYLRQAIEERDAGQAEIARVKAMVEAGEILEAQRAILNSVQGGTWLMVPRLDAAIALLHALYYVSGDDLEWFRKAPPQVMGAIANAQQAFHEQISRWRALSHPKDTIITTDEPEQRTNP